MKQIIALATLVVASASAFAFQPGMTTVQVNIEVAQRVAGGESLDSITAAANAAGVSPTVLQASLANLAHPQWVAVAAPALAEAKLK